MYTSTSKAAVNVKNRKRCAYQPEISMQKDCHLRFILVSSFCVRPITLYRERLECTFQHSVYVLLLINLSFVCCTYFFIYLLGNNIKS